MGRNAFLYLLTLGRQCYEPQHLAPPPPAGPSLPASHPVAQPQNQAYSTSQPGETGPNSATAAVTASSSTAVTSTRPVSRAQTSIDLQRSLRKAQNDVLNTIGMQLHKGGSKREQSRAERSALQEKEDDMGLLLGGIDLACMYFFTWPLIGIRNELQTFQGLDQIPYTDLLRLLVKNRTILDCFAGVSAHIIYQLVNVLREYLQSLLFKWLKKQPVFRDPKTRKPNRRILNLMYKGMTLSAFFLLYPIYRHSVLQSLHLIPATPILPPLGDFVPFRTFFSLPWISVATTLLSPFTYLESPYIWSLFQQKAVFRLHILFLNIFNRNLPRTDKFEKAELSAGFVVGEADYDEFLSLSDDDGEVGDLGVGEGDEELAAVMAGRRGGGGMADGINGVLEGNGMMGSAGEWMPFPVDESAGVGVDPIAGPSRRSGGRRRGSSSAIETQTFTATITPDTPIMERHPDNGSNSGLPGDDSGFLDPSHINHLDNEDARSGISEIEVQVTTSMRGSPQMGALEHRRNHQNNHHAGRHGHDGTRRGRRERDTRRYRNTHLSTHPVEVLSSHMADTVAMALTLGLESMVMRANALTLFRTFPGGEVVLPNSNMVVLAANAGMLGLSGSGLLGARVFSNGIVQRTGNMGMMFGIWETGRNWVSVSKALVMEWGLAWGLFEVAYFISKWVGVAWYGYRA
ncbi:hypothetical protein H072_2891 [Dactylellina haptotyla CBS 200.50]|uniref:Uncharacterized protein n=1 Tax=Dactylellina haptotyla (strain CBS 200.50) TaxID=1284197 RepID=S8AJJ6_DACHA|nr:hypothetical protein H072_2891 [Dactylellina haptotyla CBS 200.50]